MRSPSRPLVAAGIAFALSCIALPAFGDLRDQCNAAAESAQRLRRDHKLVAARDQLLQCARAGCPKVVRTDCTKWYSQVDTATPSVVVKVVDASGADLPGAKVSLDGQPLTNSVDGTELPVDPGPHSLHVERDGSVSVDQQVVIVEGEKRRLVSVTLQRVVAPAPTVAPATPAEESSHRSIVLPVVLLVVGGVAVAGGTYLVITGYSDHSNLQSACASTHSCSATAVSQAQTDFVAGDIALGVGAAAAGVGLWMLLTSHQAPPPVGAAVTPRGAQVQLTLSF